MHGVRGLKFLKLEFIITVAVMISAVVFSLETREFFIENIVEQNYAQLKTFKDLYDTLHSGTLSSQKLNEALEGLTELDNESFILKYDVKLNIALTYQRLGNYEKSVNILTNIIKTGSELIARADAVFQLAKLYKDQNMLSNAISLFEKNRRLFDNYREEEMHYNLSRLYYKINDLISSGREIIYAGIIPTDFRSVYIDLIETNWINYKQDEKIMILDAFSEMEMYKSYSRFAIIYIDEYKPSPAAVENISFELVYHTRQDYTLEFIEKLNANPDYEYIYNEIMALYSSSGADIESQNGRIRGLYYYRKLAYMNRLYRYNANTALAYYNKYIEGDVDFEYVVKNLTYTIRYLLAFKKYSLITNVVERTYDKLKLDPKTGRLERNISFWNGYSHYVLNNSDRALEEFQNTIAIRPDSYFAMNAKNLILKILEEKELTLAEYLSRLDYEYNSNSETFMRLHYAKIIYAFKTGYGQDLLREEIVDMIRKFNDDPLFDYNKTYLERLKGSENYIKFLIYTRLGLLEKAKVILSYSGISEESIKDMLILGELVKNKEFSRAFGLISSLNSNRFMNDNFVFLPRDIKLLFYPQSYNTEIEMAIAKLNAANLNGNLVYSVIRGESMYIPTARSWAGAKGLMQLMPATADWVSEKVMGEVNIDLYNPLNNIILGARYLSDNIKSYGIITAIAAYNSGYTIIKKTKKRFYPANAYELMELIPYNETRNYIKKILTNYYRYKSLYQRDDESLMPIDIEVEVVKLEA